MSNRIRIVNTPETEAQVADEQEPCKLPPVRFNMNDLVIEELPVPSDEWLNFELQNPAMPAFSTVMKDYFGPAGEVKAFLYKIGNEDAKLYPCKVVSYQRLRFGRTAWEHLSLQGKYYYLEADRIDVEQVLIDDEDCYVLCIRPTFYNLKYFDTEYDRWCGWQPVPPHYFGQSWAVEHSGKDHIGKLFVVQQVFLVLEEGQERMESPECIRFDSICDEIFGDD